MRQAIDGSLRRLLRHVVLTFEEDLQRKCLVEAYQWYYRKLEAIGDITPEEKEAAAGVLDPEIVTRKR